MIATNFAGKKSRSRVLLDNPNMANNPYDESRLSRCSEPWYSMRNDASPTNPHRACSTSQCPRKDAQLGHGAETD
jgi:hypothetical protein